MPIGGVLGSIIVLKYEIADSANQISKLLLLLLGDENTN